MTSQLDELKGRRIVDVDYHHRCQWFTFETDDGQLIRFEAWNDSDDEFGKSMTYFTNFANFDLLAIRIKEVGVILSGVLQIDNAHSDIEHISLFTDRGIYRFSCVNRQENRNQNFGWRVTVYKKA
jgi:hypothetical protein